MLPVSASVAKSTKSSAKSRAIQTKNLLTKTFIGLTHPEDCQRDMSELAGILRGNADSWSNEKRCVRKDGSVVAVGVHGAVVRDDAGRAVRIVAMVNDLTTSKQAGQERDDAESNAEKRKGPPPRRRLKKPGNLSVRNHHTNDAPRDSDRQCGLVPSYWFSPVGGKPGRVRASDENVRRNRGRNLPRDVPLCARLLGPRSQGHPHPPDR